MVKQSTLSLRQLRRVRNLSIEHVSELTDLKFSVALLSKLERGIITDINDDLIYKLAMVYKVKASDIVKALKVTRDLTTINR